jgi:hypothetical protein
MIAIGRSALLGVLVGVVVPGSVRCEPIRIGSESLVRENPRSHYSRYVNWRPADGDTITNDVVLESDANAENDQLSVDTPAVTRSAAARIVRTAP